MFTTSEDSFFVKQKELINICWAIGQLLKLSGFKFSKETDGLKEILKDFFINCGREEDIRILQSKNGTN